MSTDPRLIVIRRIQGDLSQNQFAKRIGVDSSTLSLVLSGKRGPNLILIQMLRAFPEAAQEIAAALAISESEKQAIPA